MIVSTKGRYALRVMVCFARRGGGEYIPLKEIAEAEGISQKYLESIMSVLSKAGFVDAVHGKGGGYRLNREPKDYTIGSILKLTEGSLNVASCTTQGAAACSRSECCQALPMWEKLDKMIDDFFEGITLEDLLQEEEMTFSEALLDWLIKKDLNDPDVYKKANIDRKLFSKIRNNPDYKPKKNTAIALAFALELNLEETKEFIGRAGYALTHSSKYDIIIEYFIRQKNYNVFEINEVLFAYNYPLIGA